MHSRSFIPSRGPWAHLMCTVSSRGFGRCLVCRPAWEQKTNIGGFVNAVGAEPPGWEGASSAMLLLRGAVSYHLQLPMSDIARAIHLRWAAAFPQQESYNAFRQRLIPLTQVALDVVSMTGLPFLG